MARVYNKATLSDKFKQGATGKVPTGNGWYGYRNRANVVPKDPLQFANSNELAKMKRKK